MHDRIVNLYERNASAWTAMRGRTLIEGAWLDRLTAPLSPAASILDLGCGSGDPIGRALIVRGYRVTGVDSSSSLIAAAARELPEGKWIATDMRGLDLDGRFDAIVAWHSFFHLSPEDQRPMFATFAAHLNPGGRLMFTSGPGVGDAIGEWQGEPLYHGSLDHEEYRGLLSANGFAAEVAGARDPECGDAIVWIAQMSPASGEDGSA